jgi:hypothetical protein
MESIGLAAWERDEIIILVMFVCEEIVISEGVLVPC